MIYFNGLSSAVEGFYLGLTSTGKLAASSIVADPETAKYLYGKTVIITRYGYTQRELETLAEGNKILFRVKYPEECMAYGEYRPYLHTYIPQITWSGFWVPQLEYRNWESQDFFVSADEYISYPKGRILRDAYDSENNFTSLGFLQYQIGGIGDMDIAKLEKGFI